jgi:type II secretory pathway component PulM
MGAALGFTVKKDSFPARGERIARWLEAYMAEQGLSVGEIAFKLKADKRDVRRLLAERSCGPRLNDDLEAAFGWDFIEAVATPVVGADPITARERAIEQRLAQAAALHERVERERAVRAAASPRLALVAGAEALSGT